MNWLHSRHFGMMLASLHCSSHFGLMLNKCVCVTIPPLSVRQQSTKRQWVLHNYSLARSFFALLIESFSRRTQVSRFKKSELSIFPIKVDLNCHAANKSIHQSPSPSSATATASTTTTANKLITCASQHSAFFGKWDANYRNTDLKDKTYGKESAISWGQLGSCCAVKSFYPNNINILQLCLDYSRHNPFHRPLFIIRWYSLIGDWLEVSKKCQSQGPIRCIKARLVYYWVRSVSLSLFVSSCFGF